MQTLKSGQNILKGGLYGDLDSRNEHSGSGPAPTQLIACLCLCCLKMETKLYWNQTNPCNC